MRKKNYPLQQATITWLETFVIALLASLVFINIYGLGIIKPTNYAWMMSGDAGNHYLGWQFFRQEVWQWPPGRILAYGFPMGSAIVFTDSIPLFAILFKPFSGFLPAKFQYFGLWMVTCYILNGYFGLRLLAYFTDRATLRLFGAFFFILSPPLLLRGGGHEALMAHWLILAGIETCLRSWSWRSWMTWSTIAVLTHPYLLVMILGFMTASVFIALWLDKSIKSSRLLIQCISIGLILTIIMSLTGYFNSNGSLAAEGYGFFSMNILSLIDPWFNWSQFIKQMPLGTTGQYEGFLYLGAGIIVLGLMALALFLAKPQLPNRRWWPLIIVTIIFWILALSNVVMLGSHLLFTVPLPEIIHQILSVFRASGRFGWPAFYLINFLILAFIIRRLRHREALIVLGAAIILQIADQREKFHEFRTTFHKRMEWQTPLQSPQWAILASHAKAIIIVPPHPKMETLYLPFAHLATQYQLVTNAAHMSRDSKDGMDSYGTDISVSLKNGHYNPQTIYVFPMREGVEKLPIGWRDNLLILDGYQVLPPNLPIKPNFKAS